MLNYSETYQQFADKFAQKHDNWSRAAFVGVWKVAFFNKSDDVDDWLLFEPIKTMREKTGLYHFILINKTQIVLFRDTTDGFKNQSIPKRLIVLTKYKIIEQENLLPENKPIRNSKFLQTIADKYAANNGAFAALFVGYYYEYAVYTELYIAYKPMTMATGAPAFILVNKTGQVRYVKNFDDDYMGSFHILDKLSFGKQWKRGERVYNELMTKYEKKEYYKSEKEYLSYLHDLDLFHWVGDNKHGLLEKETIFEYLEAAERIGDKIYIIDNNTSGEAVLVFKNAYNMQKHVINLE